jgi:hypothetical protein
MPFPKPPIIGELLLRLPSSSGKPPVSQSGAAFAVRNHGATMKETGHGQPGRGGANRDGRVPVCPHGGGVLGSHRGDQVALLHSLGCAMAKVSGAGTHDQVSRLVSTCDG